MDQEKMIQMWIDQIYNVEFFKESDEQYDYESLATGFFVAKGATPQEAFDLYQLCIKRNVF